MATVIAQCKMCRKPFQSYGSPICNNCIDEVDKSFIKIKDYIYDNPGNHSAEDLSEATGISREIIIYLIKENRLTADNGLDPSSGPICGYCKRPIQSGAICDDCKKKLSGALSATLPKVEPKEKKAPTLHDARYSKMHVDIKRR